MQHINSPLAIAMIIFSIVGCGTEKPKKSVPSNPQKSLPFVTKKRITPEQEKEIEQKLYIDLIKKLKININMTENHFLNNLKYYNLKPLGGRKFSYNGEFSYNIFIEKHEVLEVYFKTENDRSFKLKHGDLIEAQLAIEKFLN
jgi:hypothetical protein